MTNVEAKLSLKGKRFEVLVDVDKAVQLKKGMPVNMANVLAVNEIFSDIKKGIKCSKKELMDSFGTEDVFVIADRIIKNGEVNIPMEMRKADQENKVKQVVDFLARNALDPRTGKPYTPNAIESAISQAGVKIENKPIDSQIPEVISKLRTILPIRIETKKLKITIPAMHSGKVYGLVKEYKEKEDWLSNGDLQVIVNIPAGLQMEFYDKLNGVTHGSSVVEEVK